VARMSQRLTAGAVGMGPLGARDAIIGCGGPATRRDAAATIARRPGSCDRTGGGQVGKPRAPGTPRATGPAEGGRPSWVGGGSGAAGGAPGRNARAVGPARAR